MTGRIITALVLVVVLSACLIFWAVPWAVERGVATAFSTLAPGTGESLQVRMERSRPDLLFAAGHVGRVSVELESVAAGEVLFDRMVTTFTSVYIDMARIFDSRRFDVFYDQDILVTIEICAETLTEQLEDTAITSAAVHIDEDGVVISGEIALGTEVVGVVARGEFITDDGIRISFRVDELALDGISLPDELRWRLLEILGARDVWIDLAELTVPLKIESVSTIPGRLRIEATGRAAGN